jgi:outer membrane biosynthesis protein TonB
LLNRDEDEVPSEVVPVTDGGEIVSPVDPIQPAPTPVPIPVPVQPVQPATPVYVPIESGSNENAPVETVKPENKTEQPSDKPSSQTNDTSNAPVVLETAQPEVAVISNRLAKRLDKYNRVNRYGNFIKDRQEEHPGSRYLDRMERRADRKEERAYNRLSKTAARQGVNFGTNQDEFAYIKPATPTYVGPYNK